EKVPEDERPPNTNFYDTIRISHDDENNTLHYENVTVRIPYPEHYDVLFKNGFIDLMWLNGTEKFFDRPTSIMDDSRFSVIFEDTDNNGVDDTIVFTVPKLSASDYGLPGYSCVENTDNVAYTAAKTTDSGTWTPSYNCLSGGLNCQMVNVSIDRRYLITGAGAGGGSFYIDQPITGTDYYLSYIYDVDSCSYYDSTLGGINRTAGICDETCDGQNPVSGTVGTCNLTGLGFNTSSYTYTIFGGNKEVTDVFAINYTWCWQEASPQLSSPQIKSESAASWGTTTTGGWGERFYFNISVVDQQGNNVNLTLWWNETYGVARAHSYLNGTLCSSCGTEQNKTLDYKGFVCNTTYSQLDTDAYFRINASDNSADNYNNSWGPDSSYSFVIEKDEVNVYNISPGWNATVNRSTAFNFTIQIVDADRNAAIISSEISSTDSRVDISWFGSSSSFSEGYITVNNSGYLNRQMENTTISWCHPDFYLGQNYWKGGVSSGADCFKGNLTEPTPANALPFMLYGDLLNTITLPDGSANYSVTDTITFKGTIKDDCDADITSSATVYFKMINSSGYEVANCLASYDGGESVWKCSIATDFGFYKGYYNITMNSSKAYYHSSSSTFGNAFYLKAVPLLENPSVDPGNGGWGAQRNFTINVTDDATDTVTVYLWEKESGGNWAQIGSDSCNPCSGTVMSFLYNYTCTQKQAMGTRYYMFNATDT
ncbi:MAG: hypothetical protein KAJ24_03105, partial [Candidatus Aenigmarchaeota archaeon]|nr:hypothetical protein [Candidatus Aenigmarchaeota archaeon]